MKENKLLELRRNESEGKERDLVSLIGTTKNVRPAIRLIFPSHANCSLFRRTTYTFMIYSRLFVICTHAYT